jgi:hypothetical protein
MVWRCGAVRSWIRSIGGSLLLIAAFFSTAGSSWSATGTASTAFAQQVLLTRFLGQVITVNGPSNSPTGFMLGLRARVVFFRATPETTWNGLSAEAVVEGVQQGDYAYLAAHRVNHAWVATQVDFDVRPVVETEAGVVTFVNSIGRRFRMQTDADSFLVQVTRRTKYQLEGQTQPVNLLRLNRGDTVRAVIQQTPQDGWVALLLNVRTTTPPLVRSSQAR